MIGVGRVRCVMRKCLAWAVRVSCSEYFINLRSLPLHFVFVHSFRCCERNTRKRVAVGTRLFFFVALTRLIKNALTKRGTCFLFVCEI